MEKETGQLTRLLCSPRGWDEPRPSLTAPWGCREGTQSATCRALELCIGPPPSVRLHVGQLARSDSTHRQIWVRSCLDVVVACQGLGLCLGVRKPNVKTPRAPCRWELLELSSLVCLEFDESDRTSVAWRASLAVSVCSS